MNLFFKKENKKTYSIIILIIISIMLIGVSVYISSRSFKINNTYYFYKSNENDIITFDNFLGNVIVVELNSIADYDSLYTNNAIISYNNDKYRLGYNSKKNSEEIYKNDVMFYENISISNNSSQNTDVKRILYLIEELEKTIRIVENSSFISLFGYTFSLITLLIITITNFYVLRIKEFSKDSIHYGKWYYNNFVIAFIVTCIGIIIISICM